MYSIKNSKLNSLLINVCAKWDYIVILVISMLVPLFWTKSHRVVTISDFYFPLDYNKEIFSRYFYTWMEKFAPGVENSRGVIQLPYQSFVYFLSSIGLSLTVVQYIFFVILIFIAAAYFFKTLKLFIEFNSRSLSILGIFFGLFYVFNVYSYSVFWGNISLTIIAYCLLPLVEYHFIRLYYLKQYSFKNAFKLVLALSLLPISGNPVFIFTFFSINLMFSFFYYLFRSNYSLKYWLKITIVVVVFVFAVNSYWLLPFLATLGQEAAAISGNNIGFENNALGMVSSIAKYATPYELLNLRGFWQLYSSYEKQPYYDFSVLLLKYGFISTLYLLFSGIAILRLFTSKKFQYKSIVLVFLSIVLILLIPLSGTNTYIGGTYYKYFFQLPLSIFIRNPFDKIGPIYVYSFVLVTSISILYFVQTVNRLRVGIYILLVPVFLYTFYPLYTATIFRTQENGALPTYYSYYPQNYKSIAHYLSGQEPRLYTYPFLENYYGTSYNFYHASFVGAHPSYYMYGANTIGGGNQLAVDAAKLFQYGDSSALKLLSMLGVNRILYHDDFNWKYHGSYLGMSEQETRAEFLKVVNYEPIAKANSLNLYNTIENQPYPNVFIPKELHVVDGRYVTPTDLIDELYKQDKPTALINKRDLPEDFSLNATIYSFYFNNTQMLDSWDDNKDLPSPEVSFTTRIKEYIKLLVFSKTNNTSSTALLLAKRYKDFTDDNVLTDAEANKLMHLIKTLQNITLFKSNTYEVGKDPKAEFEYYYVHKLAVLLNKHASLHNNLVDIQDKLSPHLKCSKTCFLAMDIPSGEYRVLLDTKLTTLTKQELIATFGNETSILKSIGNGRYIGNLSIKKTDTIKPLVDFTVPNTLDCKLPNVSYNLLKNETSFVCKVRLDKKTNYVLTLNENLLLRKGFKEIGVVSQSSDDRELSYEHRLKIDYTDDDPRNSFSSHTFDTHSDDINAANSLFYISLTGDHSKEINIINKPLIQKIVQPQLYLIDAQQNETPTPKISKITKINPTKYIVNVENDSREPFLLVLNNSYNAGWLAKSSNYTAKSKIVNGFANGWFLTDEEITIEYTPQRLFLVGTAIALFSYVIAFIILIYEHRYKKES